MPNPKMAELFLIEAEELIASLEDGLVSIEERPEDQELINTIFRAAHTIKGSAGLSGFATIVEFTHVMENVLEQVRAGNLLVTKELVSVLLSAVDVLKTLTDFVADEKPMIEIPGFNKSKTRLEAFLDDVDSAEQEKQTRQPNKQAAAASRDAQKIYEIRMAFTRKVLETGQDPALLIMELADLGELINVEADPTEIPAFVDFDPLLLYITWRVILKTTAPISALDNVFIFVDEESKIEINDITSHHKEGVDLTLADKKIGELLVEEGYVSRADIRDALSQQKPVGELLVESGKVTEERLVKTLEKQQEARDVKGRSSIRVDTEKLDKLVNLVGELVTGVSQVNQLAITRMAQEGIGENDEMVASVEALDQVSRDLQEQVMLVRMVPIEATFTRFKRVVRDIAEDLQKEVKLEMSGTETELDKNVIERLADPLKHLIRNCVDHGIESPEKRAAAGKEPCGHVWLRAKQQEGNIIIEVSDDGGGIDTQAVLDKARENGLVDPNAEPTKMEIYSMLFQPGFSTAASVTDISGRGVGLDVVRRNIEELRGTVEIDSSPGEGTTFRVRLPLTLAIIEGMNVSVGTEVLTIPLLSIVEQLRPDNNEVKTIEGEGEVVDVRGEYLPLIRLHKLFNFPTEHTDPSKALVIVMENEHKKYGLLVDTVLGQQQAVIKALDTNFRKVDGVSGATIMGDGNIALILDPHRIEQMAFQ